ncbi:hypothetical protein BD626DRAFT_575458 [Schizophyllum amplum]|uniref:Uncharacterized protein n=1 Tax=Schizophyllum amplum TaxID=97359 RepID=A0A550BVT6_9AGAR|nr:hypothetical protein BD626DRAFT_575458 [Auriculariopsis ampla]
MPSFSPPTLRRPSFSTVIIADFLAMPSTSFVLEGTSRRQAFALNAVPVLLALDVLEALAHSPTLNAAPYRKTQVLPFERLRRSCAPFLARLITPQRLRRLRRRRHYHPFAPYVPFAPRPTSFAPRPKPFAPYAFAPLRRSRPRSKISEMDVNVLGSARES